MILLMLVVMLIISADPGQGTGGSTGSEVGGVVRIFVLLGMVALLFGNAGLGEFGYLLLGFMALVMAPIIVAAIFSVWAGTRPSASP
jgi:hypothetical protein